MTEMTSLSLLITHLTQTVSISRTLLYTSIFCFIVLRFIALCKDLRVFIFYNELQVCGNLVLSDDSLHF